MRRNAILLLVFIDLLGFGLILPLLPFAAQGFGADSLAIGALAAVFPLLQTFVMPFWGNLSDRIGRRPVILVSALGSVISYTVFGLASSYRMLFLSRAIAGAMAANLGVAKAYLADVSEPGTLPKNMGLYAAAQALGFLLGPVAGALLSSFGLRGPGFAAAGLSAVSLGLALLALSESLPSEKHEPGGRPSLLEELRNNPGLVSVSVTFFLLSFAFSHLFIAFPLYIQQALGYGARETGYFFMFLAAIAIVVQGVFFGKIARVRGENALLLAGMAVMATALLIFPPLGSLAGTLAFVLVVTAGYSLANPAVLSLISRSVGANEQGLAAGVSESLGGIGRVLGPVVAGAAIRAHGPYFAFVSSAVVTIAALVQRTLSRRSGLISTVARVRLISEDRKHEMYDLFQKYYKDVTYELFSSDLAEKNFVLMLWDEQPGQSRRFVGFSTILLRNDGAAKLIFSGDTVVHEDYWGSKILQKGFARFLARTKLKHPATKVHWMLMSKGFKTYLLMRHNMPKSFPNFQSNGPEKLIGIKNRFYAGKYGSAFDPDRSRVHFTTPHGAVRGQIAAPGSEILNDPEVAFFLRSNPNYTEGDELACIAEVRLRDILYIMAKYIVGLADR